jgi:hypothetical protein
MTVVRSSVFTKWEGVLHPHRLLIAALNKVARPAIADLEAGVLPFCREHAQVLWSGRLSQETLTIRPKMAELTRQWSEKYHLGMPEWLRGCIDLTLREWLTTPSRQILIPTAPTSDSYVFDLMIESQTEVLNEMREPVGAGLRGSH